MANPRVAIVTGGTGALGGAVVARLLADGAVVAVPWRGQPERDALRARLPARDHARLTLVRCADAADPAAVDACVGEVVAAHGRIDVLVAAVGGFAPGALVETERALWDRMLSVNLTSAFAAARAVVPHMVRARSGRVVTVASRAVVPPLGGFIAYTVSKAGVIALTLALADEVRAHGVTVNAVLPGTMDTPANRAAMPDVDPATWVPVAAVADAVAYLASEGAGHVTGTLLAV